MGPDDGIWVCLEGSAGPEGVGHEGISVVHNCRQVGGEATVENIHTALVEAPCRIMWIAEM